MNTSDGDRRQPPIGHVLRTLDRLIEERFDRTVGRRGITRRQWQVMNVLAARGSSASELAEAVAPFLDRVAGEAVQQHLDPLTRQGFVRLDGGVFTLTVAGRDLLRSLTTEVRAIRELTTAGLGEHQYEQTVATLQAMIDNLENAR